MKPAEMILPSKYIQLSESYIGLGGILLGILNTPMTVDELWQKYKKPDIRPPYLADISFDNLVFALNLLFAIGAIVLDDKGKLHYAFNLS
ncbi:MAG: hypothetical protein RL152_476 [Bacteroidota bacterium]|jgi:hypothetical protein